MGLTELNWREQRAWKEEFQERVAAGQEVNRDMWGQPRVQDVRGNWFTEDGSPCCGCGMHQNMGPRDPLYGIPESLLGMDRPHITRLDADK